MFIELNNILNFDENSPPSGQNILITEAKCDGSFILHHLTSLYLKGNNNVCFVGLAQSYNHYNNVGNKLGVSFNVARDGKKLVFVEGLKAMGEYLLSSDGEGEKPKNGPFQSLEDQSPCNLKKFYELVKSSAEKLDGWKSVPTLIVVDDLGMLLRLGVPATEVAMLVHYLRQIIGSHGCLVVALQNDVDAEDDEAEILMRQIWHQSDLVLQVKGLPTGYCRDVHGQLIIQRRDVCQVQVEPESKRNMQFKVTDKNVNFFALGLSSAVL